MLCASCLFVHSTDPGSLSLWQHYTVSTQVGQEVSDSADGRSPLVQCAAPTDCAHATARSGALNATVAPPRCILHHAPCPDACGDVASVHCSMSRSAVTRVQCAVCTHSRTHLQMHDRIRLVHIGPLVQMDPNVPCADALVDHNLLQPCMLHAVLSAAGLVPTMRSVRACEAC